MNYFNVLFIAFLSFTGSFLTSYSRYHYGKILPYLNFSLFTLVKFALFQLF